MASTINDRWLWLGLGVTAFVAFKGVAYGLREVGRLTRTEELSKPKERPPPSSENAIKIESLETLALCSNVDIRKAATDLLCSRFLDNKDAHRLFSKDYHSGDPERRAAASKTLILLRDNGIEAVLSDPENPRFVTLHQLRRQQYRADRGARTRPVVDTTEEQALRRRRREAMVLNEGDRPVSQGDIIQGGRERSDEDLRIAEQALATLTRREQELYDDDARVSAEEALATLVRLNRE